MATEKFIITDKLTLYITNGHFKSLVLKGNVECNGFVKNIIHDHGIKLVVIHEEFNTCIFDELNNILGLTFMYNERFEVDRFYNLSKLQELQMDFTYDMKIDFSRFPKLEELDIFWNKNLLFHNCNSLKRLVLRKYLQESFEVELPNNIEYLELIQGRIKNMEGIEKLQSLKSLIIYSHSKMENCEAIGKLKNLERLWINGSKLQNINFVSKLKKLKFITLANCRFLDTLKPLQSLNNLERVSLSATKIKDGDISISKLDKPLTYKEFVSIRQKLYKSN